MTVTPEFAALGDETYVLLTTFRKSGVGVPTPVWIGRDGDALIVTTTSTTGKVKRLRNNPKVELVACDVRGNVKDGAQPVSGVAELLSDEESKNRLADTFRTKYGLRYRAIHAVQRLRDSQPDGRVVVRISPE